MDETKVQIGEDVLLDIGIHSDWYISSIGYDGESVDVALRRKEDRNKEWWAADTPQTDLAEDAPRLEVTREEFEKIAEQIKDVPLRIERLAERSSE